MVSAGWVDSAANYGLPWSRGSMNFSPVALSVKPGANPDNNNMNTLMFPARKFNNIVNSIAFDRLIDATIILQEF